MLLFLKNAHLNILILRHILVINLMDLINSQLINFKRHNLSKLHNWLALLQY